MNLTNGDIEEIIRLLDTSCFNEIRIKTERFDLRLRRSQSGWTQEMRTLTSPNIAGGVADAPALPASDSASAMPAHEDVPGVVVVRAPMTGTYYRAPKPGAPPFVDIGSQVGEHTVVGIIEIMKLMNPVSAGAAGTVIEMCVADGQLIEAQHVLMRLRQVEA